MNDYRSILQNADCLITGGLGFIGSNLAHYLVELGARVTLVDSLIPEYGGNLCNIEGIKDRIQVNIADVRDEYSMNYLVKGRDFLFNLAGQTSHLDSMRIHTPISRLTAGHNSRFWRHAAKTIHTSK